MKKINLFFLSGILFVIAFAFSSCDSGMSPVDYNNKIIDYYSTLDNQIADFEEAVWDTTKTVEDLQDEYDLCQSIINTNYSDLTSIKPLKNDPGFLQSVIDFYDAVQDALDNEYAEIMSIYNSEWTEDSGQRIYELDEQAIDKIVEKEDAVITNQEAFAQIYDLTLE